MTWHLCIIPPQTLQKLQFIRLPNFWRVLNPVDTFEQSVHMLNISRTIGGQVVCLGLYKPAAVGSGLKAAW
jgi:hypothetical protein